MPGCRSACGASSTAPAFSTSAWRSRAAYFNGTGLPAEGRDAPGWRDKARADMAVNLDGLGWKVRPGPELSPTVEPGGIFSVGTVVVGSLWASRFGHEAVVIVRVDDCGEIYARLADAEDLLDSKSREFAPIDRHDNERLAEEGPRHIGDAVDALLERLQAPAPGIGFERGERASELSVTPEQRSMRARKAALARHSRTDGKSATRKARDAFLARFEDEVDPKRRLDPLERIRRAKLARTAYMTGLALKSSRARRRI